MGEVPNISVKFEEYVQLRMIKQQNEFIEQKIEKLDKEKQELTQEINRLRKIIDEQQQLYSKKMSEFNGFKQKTIEKYYQELEEKQELIDKQKNDNFQLSFELTSLKLKVKQQEDIINQYEQELYSNDRKKPKKDGNSSDGVPILSVASDSINRNTQRDGVIKKQKVLVQQKVDEFPFLASNQINEQTFPQTNTCSIPTLLPLFSSFNQKVNDPQKLSPQTSKLNPFLRNENPKLVAMGDSETFKPEIGVVGTKEIVREKHHNVGAGFEKLNTNNETFKATQSKIDQRKTDECLDRQEKKTNEQVESKECSSPEESNEITLVSDEEKLVRIFNKTEKEILFVVNYHEVCNILKQMTISQWQEPNKSYFKTSLLFEEYEKKCPIPGFNGPNKTFWNRKDVIRKFSELIEHIEQIRISNGGKRKILFGGLNRNYLQFYDSL